MDHEAWLICQPPSVCCVATLHRREEYSRCEARLPERQPHESWIHEGRTWGPVLRTGPTGASTLHGSSFYITLSTSQHECTIGLAGSCTPHYAGDVLLQASPHGPPPLTPRPVDVQWMAHGVTLTVQGPSRGPLHSRVYLWRTVYLACKHDYIMPLLDHGHAMVDTSRRHQLRREAFTDILLKATLDTEQDVTAPLAQGWALGHSMVYLTSYYGQCYVAMAVL